MTDISKELTYLIDKGYEPAQAFRFIMIGEKHEQSSGSSDSSTATDTEQRK